MAFPETSNKMQNYLFATARYFPGNDVLVILARILLHYQQINSKIMSFQLYVGVDERALRLHCAIL